MKLFHITELDTFHPLLIRFLDERYGSRVSGTVVLMAVEASKRLSRRDLSDEEHHMALVDSICGIAKSVLRPQRVPTFKEWERFWKMVRNEAGHLAGCETLVADPDSRKFLDAIVAHEVAASACRIFGTASRAVAR